jgi:hypothetical protein
VELYLVYGSNKYKLDIYPGVTVSQTFTEKSVPQKTLHDQTNYFANASINRANPANFSFTMPLDLNIVIDMLVNVTAFDLYVKSSTAVYKLSNCVMESGKFSLDKNDIALVELSGSASRLQRIGNQDTSIPGSLVSRSFDYFIPRSATVKINGNTIDTVVNNIFLELKNDINWLKNGTLQAALSVTDASNSIYPESWVVSSKTLSGAITQYVTESNDVSQTWSTAASFYVNVDNKFILNIPVAVFTNRFNLEDIFTQVFDFRMLSTTTPLSSVLTY